MWGDVVRRVAALLVAVGLAMTLAAPAQAEPLSGLQEVHGLLASGLLGLAFLGERVRARRVRRSPQSR